MRKQLNDTLRRLTGYELRRSPVPVDPARRIETPPSAPDPSRFALRYEPVDRLLTSPTFVLSSVRSGSTLLRLILDSHPDICAPHELHLGRIEARMLGHGRHAMHHIGLDERQLRFLLWDRILHRELQRSGKSGFVNKTPSDALIWADILACWPDCRFIFLHRHPAAIVDSWAQARSPALSRDEVAADVLAYAIGMEQAREFHGGLVVRYEELTRDPEWVTRRICDFLGVAWAAQMLDYGAVPHGGLRRGLGDWSVKLESGRVQPAGTLPTAERIPKALLPIARAWGYVSTPHPSTPSGMTMAGSHGGEAPGPGR